MPKPVIASVLRGKDKGITLLVKIEDFLDLRSVMDLVAAALLFIVGVSWFGYLGFSGAILGLILYGLIVEYFDQIKQWYISLVFIGTCILWLDLLITGTFTTDPVLMDALSITLLLPLFYWVIILPIRFAEVAFKIKWLAEDTSFLLGFSLGLSFSITFFAFFMGFLFAPQSPIPKSWQMLLVNVLLDGFTVLITFALLAWAVKQDQWWRIPLALFIDVAIAALLAFLSLYLGLIGTANALSLEATWNVLWGASPNGIGVEFGPYFWVMHTTFLPTLLYLLLILVAWLGKLILIPILWFLGKGRDNPNPLGLTAALFAVLASICLFSAYWVGQAAG